MERTEPAIRVNHPDKKYSKVGYEIPTGNLVGDRIHAPGVLPTRIVNTEVDNCNQTSGSKTWTRDMQIVSRVGFFNKSEDNKGENY